MVNLRRKCLQVGLTSVFGAFLIANAKPLPLSLPDVDPAVVAGASKFPIVMWQTTEVKEPEVLQLDQSTVVVAEPVPEQVQELEPVAESQPVAEPEPQPEPVQESIPEPVQESIPEPEPEYESPASDDDTFFALVVQAEGYTLGYTGMRYIASAILNLARDRGCSVTDVLYSGAYTVVNNGTVWKQNLYSESLAAVQAELYEGQIDTEIKYFRTNYYHGFGTPCFHYENVYFSK